VIPRREHVFPTRQDLDKIAPNNPVYLTRADGHASIANSAALKLKRAELMPLVAKLEAAVEAIT